MLTRRGASVLQAIVIFSFLSWLSGNPMLIIGSLTLVIVFLIEMAQFNFALKAVRSLQIKRQVPDPKFSVDGESEVELVLLNLSHRSTEYLTVEDTVPQAFHITSGSSRSIVRIKGNSSVRIPYSISALQMGEYEIGDVFLTQTDPLGFVTFAGKSSIRTRIEVYPRLSQSQISRVRGAAQTSFSTSLGQGPIEMSGLGSDFRGIREYYPGDDFKQIAWKAIAKSAQHSLMTREFEADRSLNLVFALYAKESMLDGPIGRRKFDYVMEAIVTVAYAGSLEGDRVFLVTGDRSLALAVPGQSKRQQLMQTLRSTYNLLPNGRENLQTLIRCLIRDIHRRSLIVLITDSETPDPKELEALSLLVPKHAMQMVAVRTSPLFPKPDLTKPPIKMGYDVVIAHEELTLSQLGQACSELGVHLQICDPEAVSDTLWQIYLSGKTKGAIKV